MAASEDAGIRQVMIDACLAMNRNGVNQRFWTLSAAEAARRRAEKLLRAPFPPAPMPVWLSRAKARYVQTS